MSLGRQIFWKASIEPTTRGNRRRCAQMVRGSAQISLLLGEVKNPMLGVIDEISPFVYTES